MTTESIKFTLIKTGYTKYDHVRYEILATASRLLSIISFFDHFM